MSSSSDPPRSADPALAAAYDSCEASVRANDRDRYLAGLFIPAEKRRHVFALYAFSHEIARVRDRIREPLPGEMRLQWWRDALDAEARGDAAANPIAAALVDTIERFALPRQAFRNLVDARAFDLYDDPMPSVGDLEGYCGETSSALIRLACLVLAGGKDIGGADAAGHAGVAYALTGLLRAFPWHARRGQLYVPRDVLVRHGAARETILAGEDSAPLRAALADMRALARSHLTAIAAARASLPASVAPAFLPVALTPLYLDVMERTDYRPFETPVELAQWRRQWTLWRAARHAG